MCRLQAARFFAVRFEGVCDTSTVICSCGEIALFFAPPEVPEAWRPFVGPGMEGRGSISFIFYYFCASYAISSFFGPAAAIK